MSFDQATYYAALQRWAERLMPQVSALIGGRAIGTYMRDAKGEGRRDVADSGPLRIVTGRLARSMATSARDEAVNKLEVLSPGLIRFTKGSTVPYAAVHEYGFSGSVQVPSHSRERKGTTYTVRAHARKMEMPARPYLQPAIDDETDKIRERAVAELRKALLETYPP